VSIGRFRQVDTSAGRHHNQPVGNEEHGRTHVAQEAQERAVAAGEPAHGAPEHRSHVGAAENYDLGTAIQFNLLTTLGLREHHTLLDIGCGSLRAGRLFIPYLLPGRYYGIEPLPWLLQEGIDKEVGESVIRLKQPVFSHDDQFTLSVFAQQFDYMVAQSIFSHATQEQIRRCLAEARKVLKPDGIFVATFVEGTKDYDGNRWVVCAEYTLARMREMVEEAGLVCQPFDWPHQDVQRWLLIYHKGAAVKTPSSTDPNRVAQLEEQLARVNGQLLALRNRLIVRAARRVKFFLTWLRFKWRALIGWRRRATP
jgi:SAM-dependent methyltransferase